MLGFIGAGKVGTSLSRFFYEYYVHKGLSDLCVASFYSAHEKSLNETLSLIKDKSPEDTSKVRLPEKASSAGDVIKKSDIIFVTVPDSVISTVDNELFSLGKDKLKNKILVHCSGVLSSFEGFKKCSTLTDTVSLHPMLAFSSKNTSSQSIQNAFFTLEGSDKGVKSLKSILLKLNLKHAILKDSDANCSLKAKYHLASVMVSNCVVAMFHMGQDLLTECGFSPEDAQKALSPLFMENGKNIVLKGVTDVLTGPVIRDDGITVKNHLDCLNKDDRELYRLICTKLLTISENKNPEKDYKNIKNLLITEDKK